MTSLKPTPPASATSPTTCRNSTGTTPPRADSKARSSTSWRTCANWTRKPERTEAARLLTFLSAVACAHPVGRLYGPDCRPARRSPAVLMHHECLSSVIDREYHQHDHVQQTPALHPQENGCSRRADGRHGPCARRY